MLIRKEVSVKFLEKLSNKTSKGLSRDFSSGIHQRKKKLIRTPGVIHGAILGISSKIQERDS